MLPTAGLMAAPGAHVGYALVGTSRTLVVGATTATAALSASAVGPLANGLGLTIAVGQLPKVLGVDDPGGDFFPRLWGCSASSGTCSPRRRPSAA